MAMNNKNKVAIATTSTMGLNGRGNTVYHYPSMYPHCLIAGRTGSGKSYAARSWIYNFLQAYP
ncbi:FtsK/SpoIIIE domain-containing protein, partial [Gemmiger sp. An194]|uniref:FtsK/SpoIIIE domain-containing protein n=1 Tax=Gemmiger sp. An194 TaxID=1965582 RepID=UPI000B5574CC